MAELSEYDYDLPAELIAQHPLPGRSDSRMMVVERESGRISHVHVRDLPDWLLPHDCLVINDTRVVPARLVGRRALTGGRWQGLFLAELEGGRWRLLAKTRGKVAPGEAVTLIDRRARDSVTLRMLARDAGGGWIARPESEDSTLDILDRVGRTPLPHYIRGGDMLPGDVRRYQTVYARHPGSAAAPTAGLHFTNELLSQVIERGARIARVTLHVGVDTFRPIKVERLSEHAMHSEMGRLDPAACDAITSCRQAGGRCIAIGTTSVRVLETAAQDGTLRPWEGATTLFIRPPYEFRAVDALFTNFHLPRSTLLVLVRTFGGDELIRRAYAEAIREQYRFYSYGDAMLIV